MYRWPQPNPPPDPAASSVSATRIEVCSDGRVIVYANGPVVVHPAANDSSATTEPKIGDEMQDGTVYAGISPDTHKPMYTTPADAPEVSVARMTYTFNQARNYALSLYAHRHHDWQPRLAPAEQGRAERTVPEPRRHRGI